MKKYILLICSLFPGLAIFGQKFKEHPEQIEPQNKGKAILLHVSFGAHLPAADLAERFGPSGVYGGGLDFMTRRNYFLGFEGHALFGQKIKEDPLAILRTPEGFIIGNNSALSGVVLRQRGLYLGGAIGKLITFNEERQGLRVSFGAGWFQHRILVQDSDRTLTQITGEYAKGYDRLTGGLAFNQFIGWQKLGKLKRANFMIGFEFNQGLTETRRDWDFTERKKLEGRRLDLRFGIRAAWTLPFYIGNSSEIFY